MELKAMIGGWGFSVACLVVAKAQYQQKQPLGIAAERLLCYW